MNTPLPNQTEINDAARNCIYALLKLSDALGHDTVMGSEEYYTAKFQIKEALKAQRDITLNGPNRKELLKIAFIIEDFSNDLMKEYFAQASSQPS